MSSTDKKEDDEEYDTNNVLEYNEHVLEDNGEGNDEILHGYNSNDKSEFVDNGEGNNEILHGYNSNDKKSGGKHKCKTNKRCRKHRPSKHKTKKIRRCKTKKRRRCKTKKRR